MALCMRPEGYPLIDAAFCLTSPALALEVTNHPRRFGSVASCFFPKVSSKVPNKIQARLSPAG